MNSSELISKISEIADKVKRGNFRPTNPVVVDADKFDEMCGDIVNKIHIKKTLNDCKK